MSWVYLSYELSDELSGYGNGERIKINRIKQIARGDTSNNSTLNMPIHFGSHIDYPYHFGEEGKTSSNYNAMDLIFKTIFVQELNFKDRAKKLITVNDLITYPIQTELLLVKTFYSEIRHESIYWENGPGFDVGCADVLKQKMPHLKAVGFDSISLTNFQNREIGRAAHKEFLSKNDLLILEDLDLRLISKNTKFNQIIVAPLRLKNADGAPITILGEVLD